METNGSNGIRNEIISREVTEEWSKNSIPRSSKPSTYWIIIILNESPASDSLDTLSLGSLDGVWFSAITIKGKLGGNSAT